MEPVFNLPRPAEGIIPENFAFTQARFHPLPSATGKAPYHLDIKKLFSATDYDTLSQTKKMAFHLAGDVGGVKIPG